MTDESTAAPDAQRDDAAVALFIERFAVILEDAGFPRMAARAFVALLSSENGRLTAAELAERLQASPAAISGAVRFLVHIDLTTRLREPGSRRDYYIVDDDVWYQVIERRLNVMTKWGEELSAGQAAVGAHSAAGKRLADMIGFFDFMREELPAFMNRWHDERGRN